MTVWSLPGPDPDHGVGPADAALLEDAARAAGEIALRHFHAGPSAVEKPGGLGPVTEADLEVDRMLRAELTAAGAVEVHDGPAALLAALDESRLGAAGAQQRGTPGT